jgi:dTDP-4-dehydrorhamnose reductase
MAKYFGEELAKTEYPATIIVRTSRLYGGGTQFKNFPNTMLNLAKTRDAIKVVNDQFGLPTSTKDLALALKAVIDQIEKQRGKIFHFSNGGDIPISWFGFATEIFRLTGKEIRILPCSSSEFPTKAKRPKWSWMVNESEIQLRDWKEGLREYLGSCM